MPKPTKECGIKKRLMAIEIPKYKLIKKDGQFELREYSDLIIAKVKVNAQQYNEATSTGFRLLADFIFGNNTKNTKISMTAPVGQEIPSEKIAMTAPVKVESLKEHTYVVSFTMPRRYTLESLPIPNNKEVTIEKIPSHTAAVLRFSGFVNERTLAEKTDELRAWITKQKITPQGIFSLARYNPPWTLWFLRRNEVMVSVK